MFPPAITTPSPPATKVIPGQALNIRWGITPRNGSERALCPATPLSAGASPHHHATDGMSPRSRLPIRARGFVLANPSTPGTPSTPGAPVTPCTPGTMARLRPAAATKIPRPAATKRALALALTPALPTPASPKARLSPASSTSSRRLAISARGPRALQVVDDNVPSHRLPTMASARRQRSVYAGNDDRSKPFSDKRVSTTPSAAEAKPSHKCAQHSTSRSPLSLRARVSLPLDIPAQEPAGGAKDSVPGLDRASSEPRCARSECSDTISEVLSVLDRSLALIENFFGEETRETDDQGHSERPTLATGTVPTACSSPIVKAVPGIGLVTPPTSPDAPDPLHLSLFPSTFSSPRAAAADRPAPIAPSLASPTTLPLSPPDDATGSDQRQEQLERALAAAVAEKLLSSNATSLLEARLAAERARVAEQEVRIAGLLADLGKSDEVHREELLARDARHRDNLAALDDARAHEVTEKDATIALLREQLAEVSAAVVERDLQVAQHVGEVAAKTQALAAAQKKEAAHAEDLRLCRRHGAALRGTVAHLQRELAAVRADLADAEAELAEAVRAAEKHFGSIMTATDESRDFRRERGDKV